MSGESGSSNARAARNAPRKALAGLAGALGIGAGYLGIRLLASKPRYSGKMRLPCLEGRVEVVFDSSGMPHIYADSDLDGYRALGYLMAQDRLVQVSLMLKLAKGEIAEVVGRPGVEMDRFMRTLGINRIAEKALAALEPGSLEVLAAFGEGFNTYACGRGMRLPFEFMLLGGRPRPWSSYECMAGFLYVVWLLDTWWTSDVMRERLIRSLGSERAGQLLPETAEDNNPPCKVEGPEVTFDTIEPGEPVDWGFQEGSSGGDWMDALFPTAAYGSNNWVVSGSRTASGRPILAADPHMQHNAPGLLYMFHLKTPSYDVAGAGFPGLPAVAFGHNGFCGWAATNLDADNIDLYVETFESEDSTRYLYKGEWLEAEVIEEEIRVRFSKPRLLRVLKTVHGPIIRRKGNKALALRWLSAEVQTDTFGAMLRQSRARSWKEFTEPMDGYLGPCSNQVYADTDGNIGYQAVGKVPVRSKGDGTIPYPGSDGDCEWEGPIPTGEMPRTLNPPEGFIVTANSKATNTAYPRLISKEWNAPYRNARISGLIQSRERLSPEDMPGIQGDQKCAPGIHFSRMVERAAEGRELSAEAATALERLKQWDHLAGADSVEMTIYFYSWQRLREKVLRHRLGSSLFQDYRNNWSTVDLAVENILEAEDDFWLPPGCGSFDDCIVEALEEGVGDLEGVFGTTDQTAWRWGRIHHLTLRYPLGLFWPLDKIFNVGPVPIGGDGTTVWPTTPASDSITQIHARGLIGGRIDMPVLPDPEDHSAYGGPVLRMVLDFDDLDNSMIVLDFGQSGHRLSRHYADHFEKWRNVEYFPLPYSRERVMENKRSTLLLKP